MNADGSNPVDITTSPGGQFDGDPDWSPDGSRFVFTTDRHAGSDLEIYVMNADGSGQTRLTTSAAFDGLPSWQPLRPLSGDTDCNGAIGIPDAINNLLYLGGLPAAACVLAAGNVNCDQAITISDALLLELHIGGLPVDQPQGCPAIGT
jgi:hypothetical protein